MKRLRARVAKVAELAPRERERMFELLQQYYESVSRPRFDADLAAKDDVILLLDEGGVVEGFSTLKNLEVRALGRTVNGLFSGDTVVARPYWGQRVLGRAFLTYAFLARARRPFTPFYWYLISKGYKTYLLMANNVPDHHPRIEMPMTAWDKAVLDAFGEALYPDNYDARAGVIRFDESHGQVRWGVAPITDELRARYPRVRFFEERNPEWHKGTELACIANLSWTMPVRYAVKAMIKASAAAAPRRSPARAAQAPASSRVPARSRS